MTRLFSRYDIGYYKYQLLYQLFIYLIYIYLSIYLLRLLFWFKFIINIFFWMGGPYPGYMDMQTEIFARSAP